MALKTDLTGMLTEGLFQPTQEPIPSSYRESVLRSVQRAGEGVRRGVGALTGADTMTTRERATKAMQGLDINNPADQPKILEIVRKYAPEKEAQVTAAVREVTRESNTRNMLAESLDKLGRPQEAEQVRNKTLDLQLAQRIVLDEQKLAKEKAIDDQQRSALMRLAVSQNNPRAVEWLRSNGDVSTIASVLLKDPTLAKAEAFSTMYDGDEALRVGIINGVLHKATDKGWEVIPDDVKLSGTAPAKVTERKPTSVAVTKEDRRAYNAVLSEEPEIAANLETTTFGLTLDADQKTILIDKAHQIWKNADPAITREAALRQAAGVTKEEDSDKFGTVTKG
jgi:hypothetical protein